MVKNTLGGYKGKTEIDNATSMETPETKPKRKYVRKPKPEPTVVDVVKSSTSTESIDLDGTSSIPTNETKHKRKYVRKPKHETEKINITEPDKEKKKRVYKKKTKTEKSIIVTNHTESCLMEERNNITNNSSEENNTETKDEHTVTTSTKETIVEHCNNSNIINSIHNSLDQSVFEIKESLLQTRRFKYQDKIKFLSNFMNLLEHKGLVDNNACKIIIQYLNSNTIQELHYKNEMPFASSSSFEDEMEEHTLTVIKYEYQNCVYLKDEDGNLYNLESPHDFIMNMYDNEIIQSK